MRKIIQVQLITLLLVGVVFPLKAQRLINKQNTILQFKVSVSDDILNALDPNGPRSEKEKENLIETKYLLEEILIHEAFEIFESKLKEKSIALKPVDILQAYGISYNEYGFPELIPSKLIIKNLQKNGFNSDYFLSLDVIFNKVDDLFGSGKLIKQFKLDTNVKCTLFDLAGRKINISNGNIQSKNLIRAKDFPEKKFNKMELEYMELLVEKLIPELNEAMDEMLKEF